MEGAKRSLSVVDLSEPGTLTPITGSVRLPPGSCVAVGDRALLALELVSSAPREDRQGFVGESDALWTLRDEIRSVARFDGPALVTGPTGAGKELVARAVHAQSRRAAGPFVPVNCGALPSRLVESLLFGYQRGAFTGADGDEHGLFLAAHGGTLFLDEIAEMPLAVQPKLLRVLQDGVVFPVGAHAGRGTDVRLVAATNRDLAAEVSAGRMREDLYHRLAGHLLRVPSLADRPFDIPALFVHFLHQLRGRHPELDWVWEGGARWRPTMPVRFFADLMRRSWAGNVRELQHYVERTARCCIQTGAFAAPPNESPTDEYPTTPEPADATDDKALAHASELLGLAHKTIAKLLAPGRLAALHQSATTERWGDEALTGRLEVAMADALYERLRGEDFNRTRAATSLGMSRTTFGKLLRAFGVRRATELRPEELEAVRDEAQRDLPAAARRLRVSVDGLRKQLTILNLRERA